MEGFDGYVRVSRVGGRSGESFISPDEQERSIRAWASMRATEILTVHVDLDQSGGKMSRPGLDEALSRIEAGQSAGIVVARLDRFARNLPGALDMYARITRAGGQVISVAEGIDPTTPIGKLMHRLILSLAEWHVDVARENWATARRRAVERGVHIASRTPTGYERDESGRLAPHPVDAGVVRDVFRRKASGASWRALADVLDERGVVGPYQAQQWTQRAVSHIIANRVYLGEARSGEYVNASAHDPLVDRATWEAAQRTEALPAARGEPALLAGLLRCAGCRHLLKPDTQQMRDGQRVRTYRCRGRHASGTCRARAMVLGSVVEPFVTELALARLEVVVLEPVAHSGEREGLEAEQEAAREAMTAYRDDARVIDLLGMDGYLDGLRPKVERAERAERKLAAYFASIAPKVGDPRTLRAAWPDMDTRQRQVILRAALDAVFLSSVGQANVPISSRTVVFWRGEAPTDLPGRGRRVPFGPLDWPPSRSGV